jgi:hypothetical protein
MNTSVLVAKERQPGFPFSLGIRKPKIKKIRRKRATVARYSMLSRFLCNALQRDGGQPGPDLAFGLCCYVPGASIKLVGTPRKRARSLTSACSPCCTWTAS